MKKSARQAIKSVLAISVNVNSIVLCVCYVWVTTHALATQEIRVILLRGVSSHLLRTLWLNQKYCFNFLFCLCDQYRYSKQIFVASNCIQSTLYVLKCLIISFVVCFCSIGLKMPVCKRQISVKISNRSHLLGLGIGFNTRYVPCATILFICWFFYFPSVSNKISWHSWWMCINHLRVSIY